MTSLPQPFADHIISAFGPEGEEWLKSLPAILEEVASKWSLYIHPPFQEISNSYVAPATRKDGEEVVVKMGMPSKQYLNEIDALHCFNGNGTVALLEAEPDLGVFLLERLSPGKPVFSLDDDEQATRVAGQIMSRLHEAPPTKDSFPTVADWAKGLNRLRKTFNGKTGHFPGHIIEMAEDISSELLVSMERPVLLHGDLHHWNILSAQRAPWLAIDPKGVIGEPVYETGAWLRNPFPHLLKWDNPRKILLRRVDQFAVELGFDWERTISWGFYQAVLAAWWSYEDNQQDWKKWLSIAQLIYSVT